MKTLSVLEAQEQLPELIAEANRGELIVLTDGTSRVTLCPSPVLDPEEDSPELEAELLKAIDGPFTPFSPEDLGDIAERIIREKRSQRRAQ
jgi:antitoxin (DNA-binding transcriptional repressor) of toxin-antitoxin stability system